MNDSQGQHGRRASRPGSRHRKAQACVQADAASYVIVNAFLIVIWAVSGAGYFWPVWVMGGWGLGLAFTAYKAYGPREAITDDEVAHEMTRLRGT